MRIDQGTLPDQLENPSPEGRPATARPKGGGLSNVMLTLLLAGTSWAIASTVSIWLVTPYLILMAWLLFPSTGQPSGASGDLEQGESDSSSTAQAGEGADDPDSLRDGSASAGSSGEDPEPATSPSPTKARRGKGRSRKVKQPAIEPTEATWVQVAPGKFVRVEASEASTPAGPHGSPGVPVEVGTTPQPLEPFADASPPFDSIEGPEGEPEKLVESETSILEVEAEETQPAETLEEPSEVDGNAPQAEGVIEETGAEWLEPSTDPTDDQVEAEPSAEPLEDWDEQSSLSEAFEPIGSPAFTDVTPEESEEWREPQAEADPTETPVDETDFDDAGPDLEADLHDSELSADDADEPEPDALQGSPTGSNHWPWRLASRALNRGGSPSRTFGRPAASRRVLRSSGPSPRPSSSRRPGRRQPGRPRRIIRAFPPRSPPVDRGDRSASGQWSVVSGWKIRDN